jgi:hypothetical protein
MTDQLVLETAPGLDGFEVPGFLDCRGTWQSLRPMSPMQSAPLAASC